MTEVLSYISADLTVVGDLNAAEPVEVAGRIIGNITSTDRVILTETGSVEGDISAQALDLYGTVKGVCESWGNSPSSQQPSYKESAGDQIASRRRSSH